FPLIGADVGAVPVGGVLAAGLVGVLTVGLGLAAGVGLAGVLGLAERLGPSGVGGAAAPPPVPGDCTLGGMSARSGWLSLLRGSDGAMWRPVACGRAPRSWASAGSLSFHPA